MPKYQIFTIQAIVAIFIAVIISRIFFGALNPIVIIGIAAIMLGLAYLSAYLKKK